MTKTTNATARTMPTCSGAGKAKREAAFAQIAPTTLIEYGTRADAIKVIDTALGSKPTDAEIAIAKRERTIGIVAMKLTAKDFVTMPPKGADAAAMALHRLANAATLVCDYAPPRAPDAKQGLTRGKIGFCNKAQYQLVRNAQQQWSQIAAELNIGGAQTQKEANNKKAATKRAASRQETKAAEFGKETAPSHVQLVTPNKALSSADYVQHMQDGIAKLCTFDDANAKKRPTTHGAFAEALMALRALGNEAASTFQLRQDEAAALAAAKSK